MLSKLYKLVDYIDSGSHGKVYSAVEKATGNKVAIKRITNVYENRTTAKRLLREIKIIRVLNHPNIIKYHRLLYNVKKSINYTLSLILLKLIYESYYIAINILQIHTSNTYYINCYVVHNIFIVLTSFIVI